MQSMLEGKHIFLRPLRITDAPRMTELLQEKAIIQWTLRIPHPYTQKHAQEFIKHVHKEKRQKKRYTFGIISKTTKTLLGVVDLFQVDWQNKNAELGYWLGKPYWKKGIMTEAVSLVLRFAFKEIKLHRVSATLFEANIGSRRVLEKNGFQLEGILREERKRKGQWHNTLYFGLLQHEWKRKRKKEK